jgi:hypothetical protein
VIHMRLPASGRKVFAATLAAIVLYSLLAHFTLARAQSDGDSGDRAEAPRVSLPLQVGFFNGATALYITPEVGVDPNAPAATIAAANRSQRDSAPISFLKTSGLYLTPRLWMTSSCSLISLKETC